VPDAPAVPAVIQPLSGRNYFGSAPWYRSYGYGSSDEDMTSTGIVSTDVRSKSKGTSKPRAFDVASKEYWMGLKARNVNFKQVVDGDKDWIKSHILPKGNESFSTEDEHKFRHDLLKCENSDEPVFQRTVMMDLIDRHQIADTLDYTCESQWQCERMPQRGGEAAKRMPKPKPDLAVAFKTDSILETYQQGDLGDHLQTMCPETLKEGQGDRAFHFLSIEAKGASGDLANCKAHRQNFNTATQALHNICVFMRMAGGELLESFF
jgi:hypothetical protein